MAVQPRNIVGISAFFHESACCLIQEGRLVAAAEEERFSRIKHDPAVPLDAFRYCLSAGGIGVQDVDCIAYYEQPVDKLARQLWSRGTSRPDRRWLDSHRPEIEIRQVLGYEGPIRMFSHHESHAASSYLFSGFDDAAILTVDGVGEWATMTYGRGRGRKFELFDQVDFPHSLGLLYSAMTAFLGFRVNGDEYKVMGLAPYGQPSLTEAVRTIVRSKPGPHFTLDLKYFDFLNGQRMFSGEMERLFGQPARKTHDDVLQVHKDIARSVQLVLEEILLEKVRYLRSCVDSDNLCMAGGVALNCVANGRIRREGPFRNLFVQPAAGDAGGSLGAAALAWVEGTGMPVRPLSHAYLGPAHDSDEIAEWIRTIGLAAADHRGRFEHLIDDVVRRLEAGKVVGWFQGRMEFGPRALGARSILADPRAPDMRERLNSVVKRRESFRPFAPSVLEEHASAHFELDHASAYMLETCAVRSPIALPAVTHVDGSARPQTVSRDQSPRFAALLEAFGRRTGCPILLNTSFNVKDEPIVCSPLDAIRCFASSGIDVLAIEDFIIDRSALEDPIVKLLETISPRHSARAVSDTVYTLL